MWIDGHDFFLFTDLWRSLYHVVRYVNTVKTAKDLGSSLAGWQLGMQQTSFRPIETTRFDPKVVPTEIDRKHRNRMLWGEGQFYLHQVYL